MKKRRHHFVWRKYLKPWSDNEQIWCLRDGKIFQTNLMNIGQIRDFYKLNEPSANDLEFINAFVKKTSHPELLKLNKRWIDSFSLIFQLKKEIEKNGVNDENINNLLEEKIYNAEEDLHEKIESSAIKYIELILNHNISFYSSDTGLLDFTYYVCVQYMRTQKIRTNMIASFTNIGNFDISKIWNILSHVLATNMAWNIYLNEKPYKLILLINNTISEEFITGDQPIINTHAKGLQTNEIPEKLEFYYPLSPKLSVLITTEDYGKEYEIQISDVEIKKYNQSISVTSHSQLYSKSEKVLKKILNEI